MKIKFLGTGTSTGVPEIGCKCEVCTSNNIKDRRLRASVLLNIGDKRILIDCGPDFREQIIHEEFSHIHGVLLTHEHYDHVGGLDDLRPFCRDKGVDIYAEDNVAEAIITRMPYAFREFKYPGVPNLELIRISEQPFDAAGIKVIPIRILHGKLPILGYRIGNFAYLTDLKYISDDEIKKSLKLNMFGSSVSSTIPILTQYAKNREKDVKDKYRLTIIEEPEINEHPLSQAKFIEALFPKTRPKNHYNIIETHSDHLFDGFRLSVKEKPILSNSIIAYWFTLDENRLTTFEKIHIIEGGRVDNWPESMFDQFEINASQLL